MPRQRKGSGMDGQKAADILHRRALEMLEESKKKGIVVGGCYVAYAHVLFDAEAEIREAYGLPDRQVAAERNARTCHNGGAR